jgi:hypothetical protein
MSPCPGRITLVRRALGELPIEEQRTAEEHLHSCDACSRLAVEIEANMAAFATRRQPVFDHLTARLARRGGRRRWLAWTLVPAVATVAVLAVALWPEPPSEGVAFKGTMALEVVAKHGDTQRRVRDGDELQEGDALRFVLTTDGPGFASVLLVDAAHRVWPFYPDTDPREDPRPWRIESQGQHELPDSVGMDASEGDEYIVAVFSSSTFDRGRIHRHIVELLAGRQSVSAAALGIEHGAACVLRVRKVGGR